MYYKCVTKICIRVQQASARALNTLDMPFLVHLKFAITGKFPALRVVNTMRQSFWFRCSTLYER